VTSPNASPTEHRLPRSVAPVRYDLRLAPDLEAATFTGEERVELDVREPVTTIVCNAAELEIASATLTPITAEEGDEQGDDAGPITLAVRLDEGDQLATFTLPDEIPSGRYALDLAFSGILNDQLRGFYRSTFTAEDGTERVMATTQFESVDARRAFPCWDEPDRKAVFAITLDVAEGLTVVSNWPEVSNEPAGEGLHRVRFGDSIAMSTYLVAFVVGELEATEPVDVDGIPVRVVHTPGKGDFTAFAIEAAAHALRFYAEWFAIPYPGAKLDLIAIPDFATGAMENLGAVTFRETELLADPAGASQSELARIAEVVEHEIAHMWFGDLVTMRWWNGIWLNEAFATFTSLICLDDFRPEWRCWDSFSRSRAVALQVDALHTTRPIEYPVHRPEDAEGMFDVLTYEKGASVLRMVERFLGTNRFRDGVRSYLAAHLYGNTETTDLWDAIEESAEDEPIRALMDSWIFQGGYPLVDVRSDGADAVQVAQEPFALLHEGEDGHTPGGPESGIGRDWLVPLIIASRGRERPSDSGTLPEDAPAASRLVLGAAGARVALGRKDDDVVVANVGGYGFYRVRYDQPLFSRLLDGLDRLEPLERYCLISDIWACAHAGLASLDDFFALSRRFAGDTDASVWTVVTGAIGALDRAVADADRPKLAEFTRSVLGPELHRIGWERVGGEDPQTPTLRSALLRSLAYVGGDPEVVAGCADRFESARTGERPLEAGVAAAVLDVVVHTGGEKEFEAVLDRYRRPADPQDERRHLEALAETTDPELGARFHQLCMTEIRSQDGPFELRRMLVGRQLRAETWEYVTSHWDEIGARFPRSALPRLMQGVRTLDLVDDEGRAPLADSAHRFVAEHPLEGTQRLVDQALEMLDVNVAFVRREREELGRLLTQA
jgi:puromycin-sensitive aminopeptidase